MEGEIKVPRRSEWRRLSRHRMRPGRRACRWLLRYPFSELRAESVKIAFPEFGTKRGRPTETKRRPKVPKGRNPAPHRSRTGNRTAMRLQAKGQSEGCRLELFSVLQAGHYPNRRNPPRLVASEPCSVSLWCERSPQPKSIYNGLTYRFFAG